VNTGIRAYNSLLPSLLSINSSCSSSQQPKLIANTHRIFAWKFPKHISSECIGRHRPYTLCNYSTFSPLPRSRWPFRTHMRNVRPATVKPGTFSNTLLSMQAPHRQLAALQPSPIRIYLSCSPIPTSASSINAALKLRLGNR